MDEIHLHRLRNHAKPLLLAFTGESSETIGDHGFLAVQDFVHPPYALVDLLPSKVQRDFSSRPAEIVVFGTKKQLPLQKRRAGFHTSAHMHTNCAFTCIYMYVQHSRRKQGISTQDNSAKLKNAINTGLLSDPPPKV